MEILAPISHPDEVDALVAAGAGEFYCGLFPEEWYQRWGRACPPNRRGPGPANLARVEDVRAVCDRAGAAGRPVYVALNAPYHTDDQVDFQVDLARRLGDEAGVAAVIVADPGLLLALGERVPDLPVFVSTVGIALNAEAVLFYRDIGARRVILSRHLSVREIAAIAAATPGVDLEVLLLNDACAFEEGLCSTAHLLPGFGVYCTSRWGRRLVMDDAAGPREPDAATLAAWEGALGAWDSFTDAIGPCGYSTGPARVPLGPCGLCAIPALDRMGIRGGKVVGREANPYRKVRSVQLVRAVLDAARAGLPDAETKALAVRVRESPESCREGRFCCYPDARDLPSLLTDDEHVR